jgi:hypothetical protein
MWDKVNTSGADYNMIQACSPGDIDLVIALGDDWAETFDILDYDEEHWRQGVRTYSILNQLQWLNWYDHTNQLSGFIAGAVSAAPHSGEITAQIHYVYLKPQHLEMTNFQELHNAFMDWSRATGAVSVLAPSAYTLPETYQEYFVDLGYDHVTTVRSRGVR